MYGTSPDMLQDMLASHCIPFSGLSYESRRQALSHHLVNGLCARVNGPLCILVSGGVRPHPFAMLVGQALLQVIEEPLFPLNILRQICLRVTVPGQVLGQTR